MKARYLMIWIPLMLGCGESVVQLPPSNQPAYSAEEAQAADREAAEAERAFARQSSTGS